MCRNVDIAPHFDLRWSASVSGHRCAGVKDGVSPVVWGAILAATVATEAWLRVTEEEALRATRSDRCCANASGSGCIEDVTAPFQNPEKFHAQV